jgi:flavodoxin
MKYQKITIYYFSGTGNSRNAAVWLAASAKRSNIETNIINIAQVNRKAIESPPEDSLIVFVSPIHGFNYPPVMLHFIARFPRGRNNVVLMNTRAGMLIGKFITPGLTGAAFWFSSLLLKLKGYSISGLLPVDLPSNWISLHPGLNERTVKYLHERTNKKLKSLQMEFLKGKRILEPCAILFRIC